MRTVLHNALALSMLGALLALGVLHTCQLDRIERRLIELERPRSSAPEPAPARSADAPSMGEGNLLVEGRPFVRAATVARGGTLRVEMPADPRGMNVYLSSGADVVELDRYIGNRLASRVPGDLDRYAPELAVHVSTPDDGLTYRVRLRGGVVWHGAGERKTLSADDFAYVFELMKDERVTGRISSYRSYFLLLDEVRVLDPLSFEVRFKERRRSHLPELLDLAPMPRWLFGVDERGAPISGAALNTHPAISRGVGTGPYRFVRWTPGTAIELERNPDYWGEAPAFDRVIFRVIKDPAAWPRLLKTGELDLIRVQPEQFRAEVLSAKGPILGEPRIRQARGPELGYLFVAWNQARPFFADARVRRAMTLALDRERIVSSVFSGLGKVTNGPFAQQSPCYDARVTPWPFDLAAAARALDEAGWIDGDGDGLRDKLVGDRRIRFEFELMIFGSIPEWESFASVYKESLAKIGVRMKVVAIDWAAMLKRLDERDFDAHTGSWVTGWDPELRQVWHSAEADRPKSSNRIGFRDAEADRVIEALEREARPEERVRLCHAFFARTHELQPYTFLYQRERAYLYWDYLNTPELSVLHPNRDVRFLSFREPRP